jgi:predicted DNA-binding transcriptional regulator AlpA
MGQRNQTIDAVEKVHLRGSEVDKILAISRASRARIQASNPDFPRPVLIHTGRGKIKRWVAAEVYRFADGLKNARGRSG